MNNNHLLLILIIILFSAKNIQAQNNIDKYVATSLEEIKDYNLYPSYDLYLEMMQNFATQNPDICKLIEIGKSVEGRKILAVKISDNVETEEYNEPEFFYSSSIHGDELCGYNLMLRLIDYLLTNYNSDSYTTNLVNNIQIYINPLANPDGTYHGGNQNVQNSTRCNANNIDLNRSFPYIDGSSDVEDLEPEVKSMIDFVNQHYFSISANLHGGEEVVNYPWDSFYEKEKSLPDKQWFEYICKNYVDTARNVDPNYMKTTLTSTGYIFGSDWYKIFGGRQDYMNFNLRCREITIELSKQYVLDVEKLEEYWQKNKNSLINLIGETLQGITGQITDLQGNPIKSEIIVNKYDKTYSTVFTNKEGYYFRQLLPDEIYEICSYNENYETISQIVKTEKNKLIELNFSHPEGIGINPIVKNNNLPKENITINSYDKKIEIQNTNKIDEIYIITLDGKILNIIKPNQNEYEISTYNYKDGIYVVKIKSNEKIYTKKLLISK
ncbi:MAG: T9SS type A sorting domain-containing protein [Bacteroidales bacterium]|nr:T9SS type A sorting domain-containing protein [Bacteroidales bacterium]